MDFGVMFSPPGQAKQQRVLPVGVAGLGGILLVSWQQYQG